MRTDSQGNPDVCRVEYTKVEEDAKVMATALKLSMNQIIADMTKVIALNHSTEVKRLCAIAINHFEEGCTSAVKALFTENVILRQELQQSQEKRNADLDRRPDDGATPGPGQ